MIRWDSHRHSADAGNPDWINPTGLDIKFLYPLARGASIFEKVTAPPPKSYWSEYCKRKYAATEVPVALEDKVSTGVTS